MPNTKTTDVEAGEIVTSRGGVETTVKPSCGDGAGHWWCVKHDEFFANNLSARTHDGRGTHRMAWWCFEHGPEVP